MTRPDSHPLRCRCGRVQGDVTTRHRLVRATCYCRDCQAFAHFLGTPEAVLDAQGGTAVVGLLPLGVRFHAGAEQLACMSLSPKGLYRWYAACCRTPIGNTPHGRGMPYVGLVQACLPGDAAALSAAFGPLEMAVNTAGARGPVRRPLWANVRGVLRLLRRIAGARLGGQHRDNPFFQPGTDAPARPVQVLSKAERAALTPPGR